jgi:hypothetical protein
MAAIVVFRPNEGFRDKLRRYKILVDGKAVFKLARGEEERIEVPDGEHNVRASIDMRGGPTVHLSLKGAQTARIRVAPGGTALNAVLGRGSGMGSNTYLVTELVSVD